MKHRLLNILLLLILLSTTIFSSAVPAQAAPASDGISTPAELESFLDGIIPDQMKTNHIPGVVISAVKDGRVFFTKGYGFSNVADQTPVDPAMTLFRIGSISKLFVWTAVMQLVEQGKLDLNADVNNYLDFQIPATYPEPITMKNLLTHTPGFEESNIGLFVDKPGQLTSLDDYLRKHIPARVFPPGKVAAYSNYGAALAGYIVERISGTSFADYVGKNIFGPLGMNHSTFCQPLPVDLAHDMAGGYNFVDGEYKQGGFELIPGYPTGSASVTADDMAKFMIAHLQNGIYDDARILSDATARQMHSLLESYDPRFKDGMAYGFIRWHVNGRLVLWHNGDTLFFHSGLHLLPDQNLGFFISNNGKNGDQLDETVFQAFMNHYFPLQSGQEPTPPAGMASRAAQYAGEYYNSRSDFTGIEKIVNLFSPSEVSTDAKGYVLVASQGGIKKYVEVKPGILQKIDNPGIQAALTVGKNGQVYLIADAPSVLIKALWYQTQVFHLSVLGISFLVLLITLIGWMISSVKALIKRRFESQALLSRVAPVIGAVFIVLLLAFLAGLVFLMSNADPISGIPLFMLEAPTPLPMVLSLPPIMAVLGVALLVFTLLAWIKRFWNLAGRLRYTLLTVASWAIIWELAYWNFLKF
jgi:CubicO group peptidase (beta-lactamase class C family)